MRSPLRLKALMVVFLMMFVAFIVLISIRNMPKAKAIHIGSKRFTESYILSEMLKQLAEETGEIPVDYRPGLGNTGIVYAALEEKVIDIYPEYTGTIVYEILKMPQTSRWTPAELNIALHPLGLGVSDSLGFQDNYALAMLEEKAENLGIQKISDLGSHSELKFGLSPEFLGRMDGWDGLKKSNYFFPQTVVKGIDHSLSYEALIQGKIDIIDIYSTDPKIEKYRLRVLEDDRHFFPAYEAVLFYRLEAAEKFPETWKTFQQRLVNQISTQEMIKLNANAELEGKNFTQIAYHYLNSKAAHIGDSWPSLWAKLTAPDLWTLTKQHLFLVFGALFPAAIVGIFLGIIAAYWPITRHPILSFVGVIQTIPALALLAFLIPIFSEIGTVPALVALFFYSLLPIVRNTYAGLSTLPHSLREAGLALGLPFFPRLYLIELPLSSGTILAGIKTAAVLNVGMATIAAFIGAGGFGERIVVGLAINDYAILLSGAIPACILAICVQFGFDLLDYYFIPRT